MISDFVKGKKQFDYPPLIQKGIRLHRLIDRFTDIHEATAEAKNILRPVARLYSGAFVDVIYDYFLANDVQEFTEETLYAFSLETYNMLEQDQAFFPENFDMIFPYMRSHNWLFGYRLEEGIRRSFAGIARRATYLAGSESVFRLFLEHKQKFQHFYRLFWKEVKAFAENESAQI